jgi:hypothetical protein
MHLYESLVSHARALRGRFRAGGVRAVLRFLATGMRAQLSKQDTQLVIVKRLDEIVVPLRHGAVRIESVAHHHLPALRELNRERGDLDGDARFAGDLEAGYRGLVGFKDEQLVSCYWWVDGDLPQHRDMRELGLGIELEAGDAYGYDLYVDSRHRAGGTVNDFLFQIEIALHERGFERLWGYVAADNRTARWTYEARGYEARWKVERTRMLRRWSNRIVPLEAQGGSAA